MMTINIRVDQENEIIQEEEIDMMINIHVDPEIVVEKDIHREDQG